VGGASTRGDDRLDELGRAEGLPDEAVGCAVEVAVIEHVGRTQDDDADTGRCKPDTTDERASPIQPGQADVDDDDVGLCCRDELQRGSGIAGRPDDNGPLADRQEAREALTDPFVGIDDEDAET